MVETMERAMEKGQSLRLTRVIKASRERVFEAWTNPRLVTKWFGTPDTTVVGMTMDLRVGGRYSIETAGGSPDKDGKKRLMRVEGVYREILPVERLCFTWKAAWAPEEDGLVTVSLREVADGTELTLEHTGFLSEQSMMAHDKGWRSSMEKLAGALE